MVLKFLKTFELFDAQLLLLLPISFVRAPTVHAPFPEAGGAVLADAS